MVSNWQFNHQIFQKWSTWSQNEYLVHFFVTQIMVFELFQSKLVIRGEFKDLGWMVCTLQGQARWRSPTTDLKISQSSIFDKKLHILSTIKLINYIKLFIEQIFMVEPNFLNDQNWLVDQNRVHFREKNDDFSVKFDQKRWKLHEINSQLES